MTDQTPIILLWLRQTENADRALNILKIVSGLSGVLAVLPSIHNPRLALVRYDQQQITSQHLLPAARDHDQGARLVGI